MISFYAESKVNQVQESTGVQIAEKLERIFRQLETLYDVKISERRIENLDGETLQRWYNHLSKDHKVSTMNNYVCILNPFLRWAASMSKAGIPYIQEDLSTILKTVKLPDEDSLPEWERPVDKYLTHDQASDLIHSSAGYNHIRDRAIISLLLSSGLRVSELCSLTIGSIDLEKKQVYCKRKGGRWRFVLIGDSCIPHLMEYLKTRSEEDLQNKNSPLFVTTHGTPCNRTQLYRAISNKQKSLDLATGPHALRHTFVSEAEKLGGASVARDLADHRSLHVTNRYDHTTQEQRREAVSKLSW
jgi:integrase